MKTVASLLGLPLLILLLIQTSFAWEPRLRHLRSLDVEKNKAWLLQNRNCPGCYLRGANFKNLDLSDCDLTGADLTYAIWTDGTQCQPGSIGKCVPPAPPQQ